MESDEEHRAHITRAAFGLGKSSWLDRFEPVVPVQGELASFARSSHTLIHAIFLLTFKHR
jgi:hypothetical protein